MCTTPIVAIKLRVTNESTDNLQHTCHVMIFEPSPLLPTNELMDNAPKSIQMNCINKYESSYRSCMKITSTSNERLSRRVSWDKIKIRTYETVLGDHPDCSCGPPISIGWRYSSSKPELVSEYETKRLPRKQISELRLSYLERKMILRRQALVSDRELRFAIDESNFIRRQRLRSSQLYRMKNSLIKIAFRKH